MSQKSEAEQERLKKLFKTIDKDGSGTISIKELSTAIKTHGPVDGGDHAEKLMGKTSRMSFDDFVSFVTSQETQLRLAFDNLDRNKDNKVTVDEIQMAMKDLGVEVNQEEAGRLLQKMDKDKNRTIEFEEWREFLLFSRSTDLASILSSWRKASSFDIGENASIPDDFTETEKKSGLAWKTLVSGGVAGAVSRTSTAPLDRLKVTYQAHGGKAAKGGLIGTIKQMVKEGGISSLWRGNGVNCLKIAPESAIKFLAYEKFKNIVTGGEKRDVMLAEKFVSGALAGATAQTIIYPMEVLKTRMTLRKTGQYSSIFDCARKVYVEGGLSVFYRGYVPNILGILPYAGIDLALYETFKNMYMKTAGKSKNQAPPLYVSLTAGAVASVCGQVATYPLALVRTKLQTKSKIEMKEGKASMVTVIKDILKHEGPFGLYRGIGPNMLKVLPAVSISYAVFEEMRGVLGIKK